METPNHPKSINAWLNTVGDEIIQTNQGPKTQKELLIRSLYKNAIRGDIRAANIIADRLEGGVPKPVTLASPNNGPVKIEVVNKVLEAP